MTLERAKKIGSIRRTVRMPDEMVKGIDRFNFDMYTSRGDFVLAAMKDFAYHLIKDIKGRIDDLDPEMLPTDRFSKIDLDVITYVNELLLDMPVMPDSDEDVTTVMVYIPEGLEDVMEFIRIVVPTLKNTTVFARAATWYKIGRMERFIEDSKELCGFYGERSKMDSDRYLENLHKRFTEMRERGEYFIDITD